jgi:hypothetical protein
MLKRSNLKSGEVNWTKHLAVQLQVNSCNGTFKKLFTGADINSKS